MALCGFSHVFSSYELDYTAKAFDNDPTIREERGEGVAWAIVCNSAYKGGAEEGVQNESKLRAKIELRAIIRIDDFGSLSSKRKLSVLVIGTQETTLNSHFQLMLIGRHAI